jgi:hypothetical protein
VFALFNDMNLGSKVIAAFGEFKLFGRPRTSWTRLRSTAQKGATQIQLSQATDWNAGDELFIASTSYDPAHAEKRKIVQRIDSTTFVLDKALEYNHFVNVQTNSKGERTIFAAEVGLLTRNVIIEGDDSDGAISVENFGARVFAGTFTYTKDGPSSPDYGTYRGQVQLSHVEFTHCGQRGYVDMDYAAYSVLLTTTTVSPSFINNCTFDQNYNTAIGVIGPSDISIIQNVVFFTYGSGIIIDGVNAMVDSNLVASSYPSNPVLKDFRAAEVYASISVRTLFATVKNNVAAGSALSGFEVVGGACYATSPTFTNNVAHSNIWGIRVLGTVFELAPCVQIHGSVFYKNYNMGIYGQLQNSLQITKCTFADNYIGVFAMVSHPNSILHETSDKRVQIELCTFYGTTFTTDCATDAPALLPNFVLLQRNQVPAAIMVPSFIDGASHIKFFREGKHDHYPSIMGLTQVSSNEFINYGVLPNCQSRRLYIFTTYKGQSDTAHPVHVSGMTLTNVDDNSKMYLYDPDPLWINQQDCVDMDCDGLKHTLINDVDGSFLSQFPSAAFSRAEIRFDATRVPYAMLTSVTGDALKESSVYNNTGIFRDNNCKFVTAWNAYRCAVVSQPYRQLVIESMDSDTETRRLSPVALLGNGYMDLLNGPKDIGWCTGFTCLKRLSTFHGVVSTQKRYQLFFSSTNPQRTRFMLLNGNPSDKIILGYFYKTAQRLDVYCKDVLIQATNANTTRFVSDQSVFVPRLSQPGGTNYFNRTEQMLYVVLQGREPVLVVNSPVIMVSFTLGVSVDEFFGPNLLNNLIFALNIDPKTVRIVNIVSARTTTNQKRQTNSGGVSVQVEIGDPPAPVMNTTKEVTSSNTTQPTNATTASVPNTVDTDSNMTAVNTTQQQLLFNETVQTYKDQVMQVVKLANIANEVTNLVQSGNASLGYEVKGFELSTPTLPTPPVVPDGLSANDTAVLQNFLSNVSSINIPVVSGVSFQIPKDAVLDNEIKSGSVFVTKLPSFSVDIVDANGQRVQNLGLGTTWKVSAALQSTFNNASESDLLGTTTLTFQAGRATFSDLAIAKNGSGYYISLTTSPTTFQVQSNTFTVVDFLTDQSNGNTGLIVGVTVAGVAFVAAIGFTYRRVKANSALKTVKQTKVPIRGTPILNAKIVPVDEPDEVSTHQQSQTPSMRAVGDARPISITFKFDHVVTKEYGKQDLLRLCYNELTWPPQFLKPSFPTSCD